MSATHPQNGQPLSGAGGSTTPPTGHTQTLPLNPPAANSAIPINIPRSAPGHMPAPAAPVQPVQVQSPYTIPGQSQPNYAPLNAPAPSNPYGAPQLGGSLEGTPLNGAPLNGNATPSPYAPPIQPGQYPTTPGMANPYPPQMPASYQVPNQYPGPSYNTPQNTGYRPLSSEAISDGPNIGMGALVGILLMIVCGLGFGFISVAAGFRIPYLSLGIGYLIGYAVLHASKENGDVQGIIGGACSLLACLIGLGIMYMNGIWISPFALVIVAFATYRGYAIPAEG